jgi:uncharacterized protein YqfB (UPF0267 family)
VFLPKIKKRFMSLAKMTFFERFEADILSGKKTITIRDESKKDYALNSIVQVSTFENKKCRNNCIYSAFKFSC